MLRPTRHYPLPRRQESKRQAEYTPMRRINQPFHETMTHPSSQGGISLIVAILLLFSGFASSGQNSDHDFTLPDRARLAARQPVILHFSDNPVPFEGYFRSSDDDTVVMWKPVGKDGEVESSIAWNRIRSVDFSDPALASELADAIESEATPDLMSVFSMLVSQRIPYTRMLTDDQIRPLIVYAQACLLQDNPTQTLGIIRAIRLNPRHQRTTRQIEHIELDALLALGLQADIIALANRIIGSAESPSDGAFAWVALGWTHLKSGSWYPSLLAACHAIAFSDSIPTRNTTDAAFIAMVSALHLGKADDARRYRAIVLSNGQSPRRLPGFPDRAEWDQLLDEAHFPAVEAALLNRARIQAILHPEQSETSLDILPVPLLYTNPPDAPLPPDHPSISNP